MTSALDMQRSRAGAIARQLLAESPAEIACIFAGGSLGRGEVWAAEIFGQLEVYSDLDIYVVARNAWQVEPLAGVAARVAAAAPGIDGIRFLQPPEIGVYSERDLRNQPLRPGTAGLATHHVLLHGDEAAIEKLLARGGASIPPEEALYLLENRLLELGAPNETGDGGETRLGLIRVLKARLDVHTAHAIVAGTFVPELRARAQRFETDTPPTLDGAARDGVAAAYRAAADPASWLRERDLAQERDAARRALSRAWQTLAAMVPPTAGDPRPERMVARRCRSGVFRANARELVRLRRHAGIPMARAIAAALFLSGRSPRCVLRVDALVRQLHREGMLGESEFAAHCRHVDPLTRVFGFTDGDLETRVRAMHRVIS